MNAWSRGLVVVGCVLTVLIPVGTTASTYGDPRREAYLDYLNFFGSCVPASIDGDPEDVAPRFESLDGWVGSFDREKARITLRAVRAETGASDLHVRFWAPKGASAPCPHIAMYRSNSRIQNWALNPWGQSFRDSLVSAAIPESSTTRLLQAHQLADSTVRLTLRTRGRTGARRGRVHEFVLVFRPEAGGYRLSFVQERFDLVYDARRGIIDGTVERRLPQGDGFVLERRTIPRGERARAAQGVAGLAGRLAGTHLGDGEVERALDRLARFGRVISRRSEARPSELLDLAAATKD
jgi:hypothetical protein